MNHSHAHEPGKHLFNIKIAEILAFNKVKISQCQIASLLKCNRKAVQDALTTYRFEIFQGRNSQWEYKWKITECKNRYIKRVLKQNNSLPLYNIINIIGLSIFENMMQCRRSEADLESYIAAEKSGLHTKNIIKRLKWALKYKDWTVENWKRVI